MVHYLVYADGFDTEGLIRSPPGGGEKKDILAVIDAYEKDYPRLKTFSDSYPSPDSLRSVTRDGAIDPSPAQGFSSPTEGSRLIVNRARVHDDRPLWVLVWGALTDVAQAVHEDPSIEDKLRVYAVGAWNTKQDRAARDYLFEHHPRLWFIEADTTFRGIYVGGKQDGDLGNRAFVEQHVRGHGALGDFLYGKKPEIKMGDSPSVLYLLHGDPDDPVADHWGGSFVKGEHGPHYWTDRKEPIWAEGNYAGAKTVNRWREQYLRDWQRHMERCLPAGR
jgi:hypothetical protein